MAGAVLAGLMAVAANGATGAEKVAPAESPKNEEMKMKHQWVQEHLTDAKAKPPFSFVYDGKASEGLLAGWTKNVEEKKLDANRTEHTMRWTDPKSGLEVRCVAVDYADYSAAEWTVYFKNTGTNNTPILENIQGLDARFERDGVGERERDPCAGCTGGAPDRGSRPIHERGRIRAGGRGDNPRRVCRGQQGQLVD